jgi:hypothetical protein
LSNGNASTEKFSRNWRNPATSAPGKRVAPEGKENVFPDQRAAGYAVALAGTAHLDRAPESAAVSNL